MIKKVKITQLFLNEKNKDGVDYVIKNGKDAGAKFTRVGIRTDQTGDVTYYNNARSGEKVLGLAVGDEVVLTFLDEQGDTPDRVWHNFKFPTQAELAVFEQLSNQ